TSASARSSTRWSLASRRTSGSAERLRKSSPPSSTSRSSMISRAPYSSSSAKGCSEGRGAARIALAGGGMGTRRRGGGGGLSAGALLVGASGGGRRQRVGALSWSAHGGALSEHVAARRHGHVVGDLGRATPGVAHHPVGHARAADLHGAALSASR